MDFSTGSFFAAAALGALAPVLLDRVLPVLFDFEDDLLLLLLPVVLFDFVEDDLEAEVVDRVLRLDTGEDDGDDSSLRGLATCLRRRDES